MLESFTFETFRPLIGSTFVLESGGQRIEVDLREVDVLGSNQDKAGRTPFSLLFLGPKDLGWPQQIYRMAHPSIGTFDLFLVPLGPAGEGMRYEAVFT